MRKISILSITVVLMTALSCGEEVLEKANRNNQTTVTYFKTESEISAALTGVYAILQSNNLGGREWF
jgi:hypothetical protein